MHVHVYVHVCVCVQFSVRALNVLLHPRVLGPPSLSPSAPLSQHHLPDVLSTRGASSFQARGETLLLPKAPCPGCKGKMWLQDPVPSGLGARHQDTVTRYPMEEGDRKWDRGRSLPGWPREVYPLSSPLPHSHPLPHRGCYWNCTNT